DLGLGVVELAPEHERHATASQRVRDALLVAESAPLRHRLLIGGVRADEIAFLLLAVGEDRERTGGGDTVAGHTRRLEQLVDLGARAGEVALLDSGLGAREAEPRSSRFGAVLGQDSKRLLVAALDAWPC